MIDLKLLNYAEIARRLNVSVMYVHFLLSGKRKNIDQLKRIAKLLNTNVKHLKKAIDSSSKKN